MIAPGMRELTFTAGFLTLVSGLLSPEMVTLDVFELCAFPVKITALINSYGDPLSEWRGVGHINHKDYDIFGRINAVNGEGSVYLPESLVEEIKNTG